MMERSETPGKGTTGSARHVCGTVGFEPAASMVHFLHTNMTAL